MTYKSLGTERTDDGDDDDDDDDDDDNVGGVGGNGWGVDDDDDDDDDDNDDDDDEDDDDVDNLQRGTKVLRHFRKIAPFCIVDIPIPFPCLPQPLPPKINVVFWTLKSFFYFRQHWFGGWGDLWRLKGMK